MEPTAITPSQASLEIGLRSNVIAISPADVAVLEEHRRSVLKTAMAGNGSTRNSSSRPQQERLLCTETSDAPLVRW